MLRSCIVGMCAISALCAESQHLRPERGQDPWRLGGWRNSTIESVIHRIQIAAHRSDRFVVAMPTESFHQWNMAHTQAEEETIGIALCQRLLRGRHRNGIPSIN